MKVLFVGNVQGLQNAATYYMTGQRLINGFTRLGHMVYAFNDRDHARYSNFLRTQSLGRGVMNKTLIDQCKDYCADLIVLGHCKNVHNDTLAEIRTNHPDVKIIYVNVDPMNSSQNIRDIQQRRGSVDAMFITTAGASLRQFGGTNTAVHFFPNPVDRALDTMCAFANNNADLDLLFLGRALNHQQDHRHVMAQYLLAQNKGKDLSVYIGGLGVNEDTIYGTAYYDLLNRSKMGISVSKVRDEYLYASDRMSHYMAAGIMTFIPEGAKFEDVLGEGAFVSFSEKEDLWEKVQYFKSQDSERVQIAKTGYDQVHKVFDVDRVCQYMIETAFERPYSADYEWPTRNYGAERDAG